MPIKDECPHCGGKGKDFDKKTCGHPNCQPPARRPGGVLFGKDDKE